MSTTQILTERALIAYLKSEIPDCLFIAGHSAEERNEFPQCVVTCTKAGGALAAEGIDELSVELLLLHYATRKPTDTDDPADVVETIGQALWELLALDNLDALRAFVNKPESGDDEREVQGIRISAMDRGDMLEGRDAEKNRQGVNISATAWANLDP